MLTPQSQQFLLKLARDTVTTFLNTGKNIQIDEADLPSKKLLTRHGTFVTLTTKNDELRGCIGKIEGEEKLYQDIIDNAYSAAFRDPRFAPVDRTEIDDIKIEISILSEPQEIKFQNPDDLLSQIKPHQDGIILKKDFHTATFLPQVWDELPDKEEFLSHLSSKAGLPPNGWKDQEVEFLKYQVEKFRE